MISLNEPYTISFRITWQNIVSDLRRYRVTDKRSYPALLIMCPGLIAGIYYRVGHWLWYPGELNPKLLYILRPFYMIGRRFIEIYSGVWLSPQARIGRGLYIGHFGSIFVDASIIGENCNLSQEVTLGFAGRGDRGGLPTLGDRVFLGAGAKVIGQITLGNDVAVGANAVVTQNLPDRAVAVGSPAKVISLKGSFDFVLYQDMENDPARLNSLEELSQESSSKNMYDSDLVKDI
ncbi:MAG: serine acetyltransferase [Chloroflexota bacterium]